MERRLKNTIKAITSFVFVKDKMEKGDLIVVPGSSHYQLPKIATDLYRSNFATKIIFIGGFNSKINKKEAIFGKEIAIKYGVVAKDIYTKTSSSNTKENSLEVLKIITKYKLRHQKILLVCKTYHARRARMTFNKLFPDKKIIIIPVKDKRNITAQNWWKSEEKINVVMNEIRKIGVYFLRGDLSIF